MHRRAWARLEGVDVVERDAEVLDLLSPLEGRTEQALAALDQGRHVLLGPPFAASTEEARHLAQAARHASGILGACLPWDAHPPMVKLREVVGKGTIGRVSAVRMRSLIAGGGGWDPDLSPDFGGEDEARPSASAVLFREAFEKLQAAAALLGPLAEVFCHAPGGEAPFARLVGWRHEKRATYGVLEIAFAPAMTLRSPYEPRDDILEITGSAGIAWLARGASQLRNEPALRVYQGENLLAYGNLEDDWQAAIDHSVAAFRENAVAGARPPLEDVVRAVSWATAAVRSGGSHRRESAG